MKRGRTNIYCVFSIYEHAPRACLLFLGKPGETDPIIVFLLQLMAQRPEKVGVLRLQVLNRVTET